MARNLKDSPFSIERLAVWAFGIVLLVLALDMVVLSIMGMEIPRPIQTGFTYISGVFSTLIVTAVRGR